MKIHFIIFLNFLEHNNLTAKMNLSNWRQWMHWHSFALLDSKTIWIGLFGTVLANCQPDQVCVCVCVRIVTFCFTFYINVHLCNVFIYTFPWMVREKIEQDLMTRKRRKNENDEKNNHRFVSTDKSERYIFDFCYLIEATLFSMLSPKKWRL